MVISRQQSRRLTAVLAAASVSTLAALAQPASTPASAEPWVKPRAVPLVAIGEGKVNCPQGYMCLWTQPNYAGQGLGVYGSEADFGAFPEEFRFMTDAARSLYNNGFAQDTKPDVVLTRLPNFQGGIMLLCNGESMADLPLDTSGKWVNNQEYGKSWGNIIRSDIWVSDTAGCR
ncbi:hypothetical protein GCM10009565_37070 [Amycolatopsis albidoflavus]